jgi:hypothetical protein
MPASCNIRGARSRHRDLDELDAGQMQGLPTVLACAVAEQL